ncbi:MAG: AmmeMemoRadiSam system protein A, partial [Mogibacterium sp.]|nr:AmmeMemoRadiSam system protein A [Mogibacterium sp.]
PGYGAIGSFQQFGAPEVRFDVRYDPAVVRRICEQAWREDFPAGTLGERDPDLDHGTMVPLYFILKQYQDFRLVRIGLSGQPLTDHYRLGQMIRQAVSECKRRAVFIASGDLSHKLQSYGPYGFAPEGPQYDERIMDVCSRAAFGELLEFNESFCEKAAECGHRSFVIMAGALDGMAVEAEVFSHEDVTGVGYGICAFHVGKQDLERRFLDRYLEKQAAAVQEADAKADPYVRLARKTIEQYVRTGTTKSLPEDLPKEMLKTRAGVFVSIHKHGALRGCIGTTGPTQSCVAEEIIQNAVSAATNDPRFEAIRPEELPWLEINVDVLGKPEAIESPDQLDPKRYGVIVTRGMRRGLLLPDLEGVDTVEQQIGIAKQKAGIRPEEAVSLQRFEVIRHI